MWKVYYVTNSAGITAYSFCLCTFIQNFLKNLPRTRWFCADVDVTASILSNESRRLVPLMSFSELVTCLIQRGDRRCVLICLLARALQSGVDSEGAWTGGVSETSGDTSLRKFILLGFCVKMSQGSLLFCERTDGYRFTISKYCEGLVESFKKYHRSYLHVGVESGICWSLPSDIPLTASQCKSSENVTQVSL